MSKIKGRYVGQLEIDFELDEKYGKAGNLEAVSEKLRNGEINDNLLESIKEMVGCDDEFKVVLTQMYADAWRVEDDGGGG